MLSAYPYGTVDMLLNSHSPIPLYQQLAERIRADVKHGRYPVDSKIPSEPALAQQYAIGRPTVRQATDLLVREGILRRRRGSGTFVLPPVKQIDLFSLAGTSAAFSQSELDASIQVVSPLTLLAAHTVQHETLAVDRPWYRLERLSSVTAEPVLLEVIFLDAGLFHGIDQHDLSGDSLARIVREVYFLEASEADQSFSIVYPNKRIARQLAMNSTVPLLQVGRTLHFGEYRSVVYCDIYCRTDRFHFSQTIQRT